MSARIQGPYPLLAYLHILSPESKINSRFTIHPSFAAIRTMGLTPVAAIAATASCICQSAPRQPWPSPSSLYS
jgi:hypothetical protein